jgi:hypothetical protein
MSTRMWQSSSSARLRRGLGRHSHGEPCYCSRYCTTGRG